MKLWAVLLLTCFALGCGSKKEPEPVAYTPRPEEPWLVNQRKVNCSVWREEKDGSVYELEFGYPRANSNFYHWKIVPEGKLYIYNGIYAGSGEGIMLHIRKPNFLDKEMKFLSATDTEIRFTLDGVEHTYKLHKRGKSPSGSDNEGKLNSTTPTPVSAVL